MIKDRKISKEIIAALNSHEIVVLLGTRQAGKTTLTKIISERSDFTKEQIFFYDFEDKSKRQLFNIENIGIELLKNIFSIEGIDTNMPSLLIFDEIQYLEDPANLLKIIHDHFPKLKVVATGSSSLRIKHKFSDSLAGRRRIFNIEPLSFDEFLKFKEADKLLKVKEIILLENNKANATQLYNAHKSQLLNFFNEYLTYGGYPEVVLLDGREKKIQKLKNIADAYIQKDIREYANIEDIDAYNRLIKYVAVNSGNLINISSISTLIGISQASVKKYINLLAETFIIGKLHPFHTNKNKEISKNYKLYFKDTGIRNLQILDFNIPGNRSDKSILYETYCFNRLYNHKGILEELFFYRTKSKTEIDFILKKETGLQLLEIKSYDFDKSVRAFSAFLEKYEERFGNIKFTVINQSKFQKNDKTEYIPACIF